MIVTACVAFPHLGQPVDCRSLGILGRFHSPKRKKFNIIFEITAVNITHFYMPVTLSVSQIETKIERKYGIHINCIRTERLQLHLLI